MGQVAQQRRKKVFPSTSSGRHLTGSKNTPAYDTETNELVLYTDGLLDDATAGRLYTLLLQAFPKMTDGVARLIIDRMAANGFTNRRAADAVNYVIDTYEGWDKCPNVANFIGFDRRVKVLTYRELNYLHDEGKVAWDDYRAVDVGLDKPRWARNEDVELYRLERWETRTPTRT